MDKKITYKNQGNTAVGLGKYYLSPGDFISLAPEDPLVKEAELILVRVSGVAQHRDRRRLYKSKSENPFPFGTDIRYFVIFTINQACNFNCPECFWNAQEKVSAERSRIYKPTPTELATAFEPLAPSIIYITGGEPLLYKDFAECCGAIALKNLVGLLSNLSVYTILRNTLLTVGTENFFAVGGSLHIGELERLNKAEEFFRSLELLVSSGVPAFVTYNVRRELEPSFDYYVERVKGYGVPVFGKYLQGRGGAVEIDYAYKKAEAAGVNMSWFKPYDIGWASCSQMNCGAGVVSLNVDGLDGRIQKCIYDTSDMGNIFTGEFNPAIDSFCAEHCYCHPYLFLPGFSNRYDNWGEFRKLVKPNTAKTYVV